MNNVPNERAAESPSVLGFCTQEKCLLEQRVKDLTRELAEMRDTLEFERNLSSLRREDAVRFMREKRELAAYAEALRGLITRLILDLSPAYQGSADKLEDALDKVDAMVGKGPYAKRNEGRD